MTFIRDVAYVEWKEGTHPAPKLQLIDRDGNPANLTGATVKQHVKGTEAALDVTVDDAPNGIIIPNKSELTVEAHSYQDYLIEFWVTYADDTKDPFPEVGYFRARVWKSLE